MGYLRTMGAGLAGSTVRYKGVNVNQIQFGDKLQGLPPVTGTRRPHRIYKRKAGGQKPGRDTIFCVNQLGGMMVKNSQFASNADGIKECSNRKNHRHHGHHMTNHPSQGQAHTAISRSVSGDSGGSGFGSFGSFLDLGVAGPGYSPTCPAWKCEGVPPLDACHKCDSTAPIYANDAMVPSGDENAESVWLDAAGANTPGPCRGISQNGKNLIISYVPGQPSQCYECDAKDGDGMWVSSNGTGPNGWDDTMKMRYDCVPACTGGQCTTATNIAHNDYILSSALQDPLLNQKSCAMEYSGDLIRTIPGSTEGECFICNGGWGVFLEGKGEHTNQLQCNAITDPVTGEPIVRPGFGETAAMTAGSGFEALGSFLGMGADNSDGTPISSGLVGGYDVGIKTFPDGKSLQGSDVNDASWMLKYSTGIIVNDENKSKLFYKDLHNPDSQQEISLGDKLASPVYFISYNDYLYVTCYGEAQRFEPGNEGIRVPLAKGGIAKIKLPFSQHTESLLQPIPESRMHCIDVFAPVGSHERPFLIAVDLFGKKLWKVDDLNMLPIFDGFGNYTPRHFIQVPGKDQIIVITEDSNSSSPAALFLLDYIPDGWANGQFFKATHLASLPPSESGDGWPHISKGAEIQWYKDRLYVSVRNYKVSSNAAAPPESIDGSLMKFAVEDESGFVLEHSTTVGKNPRYFRIDDGKAYVCNQDSDNIMVIDISDAHTWTNIMEANFESPAFILLNPDREAAGTAAMTYYNAYPTCCKSLPDGTPSPVFCGTDASGECDNNSGCKWMGAMAGCPDLIPYDYLRANYVVALMSKTQSRQGKTDQSAEQQKAARMCYWYNNYAQKNIEITLSYKDKSSTFVAIILDTCDDSDCKNCCTEHMGEKDTLIDIEYESLKRLSDTQEIKNLGLTLPLIDYFVTPCKEKCDTCDERKNNEDECWTDGHPTPGTNNEPECGRGTLVQEWLFDKPFKITWKLVNVGDETIPPPSSCPASYPTAAAEQCVKE